MVPHVTSWLCGFLLVIWNSLHRSDYDHQLSICAIGLRSRLVVYDHDETHDAALFIMLSYLFQSQNFVYDVLWLHAQVRSPHGWLLLSLFVLTNT